MRRYSVAGVEKGWEIATTSAQIFALDLTALSAFTRTPWIVPSNAAGFFKNNGSGTLSWATIAAADLPDGFSGFADPSALIGMGPTNGSATTAMRSDAAPAINPAITPDWTGTHNWIDAGLVLKAVVSNPQPVNWRNLIGGASGNVYLLAVPSDNTSATITLPNASGQTPVTGSAAAPPTAAQVLGRVEITGRTSNILSTNLTNLSGTSVQTGFFLINAIITCTVAEAAAGTLTLQFAWTDDGGAKTATQTRIMTSTGSNTFFQSVYVASGNISYSITGYSNPGGGVTPTYSIRIRITYLG